MRCALAAKGFINNDLQYNKQVIIDTMIKYAGVADIVLFGEASYRASMQQPSSRSMIR